MRLKDYLRGLGMGIMVSVLILTIAGGDEMTDAEVRARALELGMVDGTNRTLSDIQTDQSTSPDAEDVTDATDESERAGGTEHSENSESAESSDDAENTDNEDSSESENISEPEPSETESAGQTETDAESSEATKESAESSEATEGGAESSEQTEVATEDDIKPVTITVVRGDSSVSVSKDLANAGLVDSARDFDAYLCQNGYDKRISVGSFEIIPGSTYEEIAKIISRSK